MKEIILGIDPGNKNSGIVIFEDGILIKGDNIENEKMFSLIDEYTLFMEGVKFMAVYEDIRPFTSRFNMDTIDTIKMIGRLEYVLNQRMIHFRGITRNEVKNFVFTRYKGIALPDVEKKIIRKGAKNKDGSKRKPSFVYVDDRIVQKAMKSHWNIEVVNGKKSPLGIRKHAWQALSVVTFFLETS